VIVLLSLPEMVPVDACTLICKTHTQTMAKKSREMKALTAAVAAGASKVGALQSALDGKAAKR
jgi:hypothetical protein